MIRRPAGSRRKDSLMPHTALVRSAGEVLCRGARAQVLVVVEDGEAVDVLDRHYRLGEVSAGPRLGGEVLRAHGVCVDVVTREDLDGGDEVCADALRHEAVVVVGENGRESGRERVLYEW